MRRPFPLYFLFVPLLLGWLILGSPQTAAVARQDNSLARQAAGGGSLCVMDVPDTTAFPVVSLNIKVLDDNLQPGINLTGNDLRFYENNKAEIRPLPGADIRPLARQGGILYYILADTGNRTDQWMVKSILQNFSSYYINQTDKLKIFTNPANQPYLYYSSDSGTTLSQAISDFPTDKDPKIRQITSTLFKILDEIELAPVDCSRTRVLILIVGDEALPEKDFPRIRERLQSLPVKLIFFHLPNMKTNEFKSQDLYSNFSQQVKGSYHRVSVGDDVRLFVSPALETIIDYRQIYSVSYRSNLGISGLRQITAAYKGVPVETQGFASYSVQLQPGQVSWMGDKTITIRDDVQKSEKFQINVSWPDGYPRDLRPTALLHVIDKNGKEDVISLPLEKVQNHYQIEWSFGGRITDSINSFTIQAEVFDEFEESMRTPKNTLTINVLSATSTPMLSGGGLAQTTPWWVYALVGGIAFVFLASLVLFLILWKKLGDISLNGVQNLASSMAKQALQNIQKTIVGGGRTRKPVAVLRVMDGPKKLIGQDLKVTTEHITLGRDPQRTNYTFYDLETSTSVSGVHAIIERVNGNWRIVAVSESKSETFVNGEAIDFQQPVFIKSGDIIRLGYLAQQPVEFQFVTDLAGPAKAAVNQIPTQSRSSNPKDPDATLTFDPQEAGQSAVNEKTAVYEPEEKTHISITPEEKKNIKPDTDSVDDYIRTLRGE